MRDFGRVYSAFWQSPDIRSLPEDARTLAFYLLTCPHANLVGCFRVPDAYAADDLQWTMERVLEGFHKLSASGFLTRDKATGWLLIHKFLKWNGFENQNVAKAARKAFELVPVESLKLLLANAILEFGMHLEDDFRNRLQTVCERSRNPEPEPEPIQNLNQSLSGANLAATPAGSASRPPRKQAKEKSEAPTTAVWQAYAEAYLKRYGVDPVRNATVNGQLAQFVGRIPVAEAPAVAAFYVSHENGLYRSAQHPTNLLLRDAESLRTQWATGRVAVSHGKANGHDMPMDTATRNAEARRLLGFGPLPPATPSAEVIDV